MTCQRWSSIGRARRAVGSWAILLCVVIATCVSYHAFRSRDAARMDDGPAQIMALRLTPRSPKLTAHATQQLTATATFSDRSRQDVSARVRWTSNATDVATVDDHGVVSAVAAGEATIRAARGAVSGATTLTVTDH